LPQLDIRSTRFARGEIVVDHACKGCGPVAVLTLADFNRFAKRCPVEWNMHPHPNSTRFSAAEWNVS